MPIIFASSLEDGRNACHSLLQGVHPDAFFFMSDELAAGLMPALTKACVAVPQACKVMGISDGLLPYLSEPALSHFQHSGYEVGHAASARLIHRIKNHVEPDIAETIMLNGNLVLLGTA
jgi:DNA-binding LacI/PurR family transcriptional regulator